MESSADTRDQSGSPELERQSPEETVVSTKSNQMDPCSLSTKEKPKLLWIGDADVSTGFARCTHKTLDVLKEDWNIHVLGLNYLGDPHQWPYKILPCYPGGDGFGLGRIETICKVLKPDVILIQNDPWNVPEYVAKIKEVGSTAKLAASMPVDGKNCQGHKLNNLDLAIFWTRFGRDEAMAGGFKGKSAVIPLGVDLNIYRPIPREMARLAVLGPEAIESLGKNPFIIGNVNRNQPRKRLDLTVDYFAEFARRHPDWNVWLYLHVAPTGDDSYDVTQLMSYYGFRGDQKRLIVMRPDIGVGLDEAVMPYVYSSFDLQITTTQGEGWGLTTLEGMACGIPQIVPDWAALGEWASPAAYLVPCTSICVTPNRNINVIGGVPDKAAFIQSMEAVYQNERNREFCSKAGLDLASNYNWVQIGQTFDQELKALIGI